MSTAVLAAALMLAAEPVTYDLRPSPGARFALTVEKTGLMSGKKHLFLFDRYHGTLRYDAAAPERSAVELRVESASLSNKDTWVGDNDRRKIERLALDDMLAAQRYPEIVFTSSGITRAANGAYRVAGTLTIRGISKPAVVEVRIKEAGGRIESVTGESVVRIKDYGLKPPSAALGMIGTKNEMTVDFTLLPRTAAQVSQR